MPAQPHAPKSAAPPERPLSTWVTCLAGRPMLTAIMAMPHPQRLRRGAAAHPPHPTAPLRLSQRLPLLKPQRRPLRITPKIFTATAAPAAAARKGPRSGRAPKPPKPKLTQPTRRQRRARQREEEEAAKQPLTLWRRPTFKKKRAALMLTVITTKRAAAAPRAATPIRKRTTMVARLPPSRTAKSLWTRSVASDSTPTRRTTRHTPTALRRRRLLIWLAGGRRRWRESTLAAGLFLKDRMGRRRCQTSRSTQRRAARTTSRRGAREGRTSAPM